MTALTLPAARTALPRPYLLWLAGTRASLVGDAALYFALGWGAGTTGLVASGQGLGVLAVALIVARFGALARGGAAAAGGLCAAAAGIAVLSGAGSAPVAVGASVVLGAGSGAFACHLGPLVLASGPQTHLARLQSLLTLVQSLALVIANALLGALADLAGAGVATLACAITVIAAGVAGLASAPLRRAGAAVSRGEKRLGVRWTAEGSRSGMECIKAGQKGCPRARRRARTGPCMPGLPRKAQLP